MALSKSDYIKDAYNKLDTYIKEVEKAKVDALLNLPSYICQKEIQAIERYKNDLLKYDFNNDSFERVIKFFFYLNIEQQGEFKQYQLLPFNVFWIANLYGLYHKESKKRKYNFSYIQVAKKNAKSTFYACLCLYELLADNEIQPEINICASNREQARILLNITDSVINNSPYIAKRLEKYNYNISYFNDKYKTKGNINIKASNASGVEGLNSSLFVADEVHLHSNEELISNLRTGQVARFNPLGIGITTAGIDIAGSIAKQLYDYSAKVLNGEVIDESFFTCIYECEEGDDINNPLVYRKANPALGYTVSIENLIDDYNRVKNIPSLLRNFKVKNLNYWLTSNIEVWIEDNTIKSLFQDFDIPEGAKVWLGIDLSTQRDLTSTCITYYDADNDMLYCKLKYYFANNERNVVRKGGIDLTDWIDEGFIVKSNKETVDFELMYKDISDACIKYDVQKIGYDKLFSNDKIYEIKSNLGIPIFETANNWTQTTVITMMEEYIYNDAIRFDKNPVTRWHFNNTIIKEQGTGALSFDKMKNLDSIDGVISIASSIRAMLSDKTDDDANYYDNLYK